VTNNVIRGRKEAFRAAATGGGRTDPDSEWTAAGHANLASGFGQPSQLLSRTLLFSPLKLPILAGFQKLLDLFQA
jgi:hypothetical protein